MNKLLTTIAIGLLILSCLLFLVIFSMPFLPIPLAKKGIYGSVLFIAGEITWWAGVAIVGKQMISRYKRYLNPKTWFSHKEKQEGENEEQQ